tara:strand:+ start:362192 stop:362359 length:168 start_codon:yes stop_codon:yes gene_type:complete
LKIGGLTGLTAMSGLTSDIQANNLNSKNSPNSLGFNISGYALLTLKKFIAKSDDL